MAGQAADEGETGQSHVNLGTQRAVMRYLLGAISAVLKTPVIRVGGPRHHPFDEVRL